MDENTSLMRASAPLPDPVSSYNEPSQHVQVIQFDELDGIRVGKWDSQLFGCFTHLVPNCMMTYFCPCVSLAQITARIGVSSYRAALLVFVTLIGVDRVMRSLKWVEEFKHGGMNGDMGDLYDSDWWFSSNDDFGTAHLAYGIVASFANLIAFLLILSLRTKIRQRFEIPGHWCEDVWTLLCCSCCAIAQMATHVKSYKPGSCSFGPPDILPAYPLGTTPVAAPNIYV